MSGRVILITGERQSGKTTLCRNVVTKAQIAGYTCGGLLTLTADNRDDLTLLDVRSEETRRLTVTGEGVQQGRFLFDPDALRWGNEALVSAIPCDLLVIDEIGPLEIEQGDGWIHSLSLLRDGLFRVALIVVRPSLVHAVQLRLPVSATAVIHVLPWNRDELPDEIMTMLERESAGRLEKNMGHKA